MPKYFFHLVEDVVVPDEDGRDLLNMETALKVATDEARQIAGDDVRRLGRLNLEHYIEIHDDRGRVLDVVLMRDAVKLVGAEQPRLSRVSQM